jgi:alpha-L-rhamnosidase
VSRRSVSMPAALVPWWAWVLFLGTLLPSADGRDYPARPRRAKCSVAVADLRCEYLENPLGIDVSQPRLSWKLLPAEPKARGQRQTAYHILVASSQRLLAEDRADLWDSGVVASDQSVHVVYRGKQLTSRLGGASRSWAGSQCHWKVRVKDEKGIFSQWSESARWTMGLLDRVRSGAESAKWIGTDEVFVRKSGRPPPDNTMPDPWLRKVFTLAAEPEQAFIYVASIGYHELYVNGKKVGDAILSPSVVNHRKRARYVTYEITDYLKRGKNVIGLWLGVSWSIFPHYKTDDKPQSPLVIAQADIELAGGKHVTVVTDQTWKTHPSPNTLLGIWDFMHFGGELYDANEEMPGWCDIGLDDSGWEPARVFSPNVVLSAEMVEPNRRISPASGGQEEIRPVAIEKVSDNTYRVDMGVNFTGWLEMDISGKPGQQIEFKFSEDQRQAMTHRLHSKYIIGPAGKGTFRNRFNYFTGRWIQIEGLAYKPALKDVRGYLVRTDYRRAGWFECSNSSPRDKLLNDIYNTTLWTFENLSLGGYVVDCPHRERMGYGGDAHATTETALNNYSLGAFYTKWSQDWRDVQGADTIWGVGPKPKEKESATQGEADLAAGGNLPYTAPTYWGGGGPAWSGYCVTLPWEVYRRYGDVRILEKNLPTIRRWLAFLETKAKDNMLVRWGGEWDFLGDWLWPGAEGVNGDTRETLFFNNCYWIYNLQTAAKIADVLGEDELASKYRSRAEQVRRAVHKEFYDPEEKGYVNNFQAYLAIALLVGLPPEELQPAVWKRFEDEILVHREGHFWGGITGGYFIVKTLLEFDRQDLMYEMATKQDYPGWGDMLRRGATTFWESWDRRGSLLHSSYLHIGTWFIEGLAGIKADPNCPGFRRFLIKPGIISEGFRKREAMRLGAPDKSLKWVNGSYESLYGRIVSNWRISPAAGGQGEKFHIEVAVPPNTSATLYLPTDDVESVKENGMPLAKASGIKFVRSGDRLVVLCLEPGHYMFETRYSY